MYIIISTTSQSYSRPVCQNCGKDRFSAKPLHLTNTPLTPQSVFCTKRGRIAGFFEPPAPIRNRRFRSR
jgi:hypothetical protein